MKIASRGISSFVRVACLLVAGAVGTAGATATVTFSGLTNAPAGSVLTNGVEVVASVVVAPSAEATITSATLNFRTLAPLCTNTWNSIAMATNGSPTNFVATIPRLPAGDVQYYVSCAFTGSGASSPAISATNTYTLGTVLPVECNADFENGWVNPSGTVYYHPSGWTGDYFRVGTWADLYFSPPQTAWNTSSNIAYLRNVNTNTQTSILMSPLLSEGADAIYLEAGVRKNTQSWVASFVVELSTNNGTSWTNLQTFTVGPGATILFTNIAVNTRIPTRLRLRRTSYDSSDGANSSAIVLDNIRISYPPADLQLVQPANPVTTTDSLSPVTLYCDVQDLSTNSPTVNRALTLVYNWNSNAVWTSLTMTNVPGVTNRYSAVVPRQDPGTNQYYFQSYFDGYYYTNTSKRGSVPVLLPSGAPSNGVFSYNIVFEVQKALRLFAVPDLAFGYQTTGTVSSARTLKICNDGNTTLTVSNIVSDVPSFTASPTNFTVAAGATVDVSVTFAPTSLGATSGVLTVLSDKTTGTETIGASGTGMPAETVTTPSITGDAAGTLGQWLSYTASASVDNWGYGVQYRFDWGNSTTSSWASAGTVSNTWAAPGVYSVSAQARSATNTGVVSTWSSIPVSVTITNTRIIGLSPAVVDFGSVATNAVPSPTRMLTITNSGNGSLTITNITCSPGVFTLTPTNCVVAAGGSATITVTFAPTALQSYTGPITVFSDATSGGSTGTVTGIGVGADVVTMLDLALVPAAPGGWVGQNLQVGASASDSFGYSIQYRFDWGEGSTTAWSQVSASGGTLTTNHTWSSLGSYSVFAQARSTTNTGIQSSWYPLSVVITNTRIIGLSGNLAFGNVVTGIQATATLTVTNSGVASLTVTNVTCPVAYAVSSTNFTVAAGGSTNLTVFFQPQTTNEYDGVLTFYSDATSGGNTIPVTGKGYESEAVTTPLLSPPSVSDTHHQTLFFVATASDNYTNSIQYRFDWGDNSTSAWSGTVSSGTPVTNSHDWSSAGVYSVRAQAQNATNSAILSSWSAPSSVTITNQIVIGLAGTLTFGMVATNASGTNTLTVTNTGNAPLHVTAITGPSGFMAAPQSFTVATNGSTNVVVVFAPLTLGPVSGTLTVASDATSGTNTIPVSGTGMPVEANSAPVLTGPLNGTRGDTLTFTISAPATNNWGYAVEYRYGWGDGATSDWTSATSTSHVWSAVSTNTVVAQARSATHTNVIAQSQPLTVTIYDQPLVVFGTVTNGLPLPVTVTIGAPAGTVSNVTFSFSPPGSAYTNVLVLGNVSGSSWTNTLPAMNAGDLHYYLQYMRSGLPLRFPGSGDLVTNLTSNLGALRDQGFEETWSQNGNTYWNTTGWTGDTIRIGLWGDLYYGTPWNPSANVMYLRNVSALNAFLVTPLLSKGIGTIAFEAGIRRPPTPASPTIWSAGMVVEVSTNDGTSWSVLNTYTVSGMSILRPVIQLNLRVPARVRLRRTTYDSNDFGNNSAIVLDNIRISPPPTDLTLTEYQFNPGYPSFKDPVRVRCIVKDYDPTNAPSFNRRVWVYYGWRNSVLDPIPTLSDANRIPMVLTSLPGVPVSGDLYEAVIPPLPQGTVSYYFRSDFDGYYYTNNVYVNSVNENISPAFAPDLRTGPVLTQYPTPTTADYRQYTINLFRSANPTLAIRTTNDLVTADEKTMTLVGDYTWRGLVLMKKTGGSITNLTWFFDASGLYTNNAPGYAANVQSWGDTNQDFPYPPLGGFAELGATNNPIRAILEYNNLLVFEFHTDTRSYLAKRAVYQDFNAWQASQINFEASVGLYGAHLFNNDFQDWGANAYLASQTQGENFQDEAPGVWYPTPHDTRNFWVDNLGMVVADRGTTLPNQALLLNNSTNAPGQLWNQGDALTKGISNFTYRCRLSVNDDRKALYIRNAGNADWTQPHRIVVTNRASSLSPALAGMSLILHYQKDAFDPTIQSYYEIRMAQTTDADMAIQLYRWVNGSATGPIAGTTPNLTGQRLDDPTPWAIDLLVTNAGANVTFAGTMYRVGSLTTNALAWTDSSGLGLTGGGLIGYSCLEAVPEIWGMNVYTGVVNVTLSPNLAWLLDSNSVPTNRVVVLTNLNNLATFVITNASPWVTNTVAVVNTNSIPWFTNLVYVAYSNTAYTGLYTTAVGGSDRSADWYLGSKRIDGQSWWQFSGGTYFLTRPLPSSTLDLYAAPTTDAGRRSPDFTKWQKQSSTTVSSLGYSSILKNLSTWAETFVMLQFGGGDLPVVVDDASITPWRAVTRNYSGSNWVSLASADGLTFWDWTTSFPGNQANWALTERGWAVLEGWVADSGSSRKVVFDRSRANPGLVQGLLTPDLTNGIGTVTFDAKVTAGTAVYSVEYTGFNYGNNLINWVPLLTYTNTAGPTTYNQTLPIRRTAADNQGVGRVRIVLQGSSSSNAVLEVDNLLVRDYPPPDDASWKVYNALVAKPSAINGTTNLTFEPSVLEHQTCYLNNSPTNGVLEPAGLTDDAPYLETPKVGTGIGEIFFWYRAWDTNLPAVFSIKVAPSSDTPANQWITIVTNFVASNGVYQSFDISPFDIDDKVMRIYTRTNNGDGRLCIDNVLMAEPVRNSYDITGVSLLPTQPLRYDKVGVEAKIGRFLMNPTGIHVFVSYYVGTNLWGVNAWRGGDLIPSNTSTTIELESVSENLYRTPASACLPAANIDDVVQYTVWSTNAGMVGRPIFISTNSYTTPSWYYPQTCDLNVTYASKGWSPYYFVYSCPPGSVWVNEINYNRTLGEATNEYVELLGPANARIGKWAIDVFNTDLTQYKVSSVYMGCVISNNVVLSNSFNGWGFFVYGDTAVPNLNQRFSSAQANNLPINGGIRLVRSNGAWEDRVCFGDSGAVMTSNGYRYAGAKISGRTAALAMFNNTGAGSNKNDFAWEVPSNNNYSPGSKNIDQTLGIAPTITLNDSFTVYSVIGANGQHSLGALTAVQVASGTSTQIVYTADQWFQLGSFVTYATNSLPFGAVGVTNNAAIGTTQYVWAVTNISQNYSNNVAFYRPQWFITQVLGANGTNNPTGTVGVLNGMSTSIVYTADQWFRIGGFTTNGWTNAAALDTTQFVWSVAAATQNYSNNVAFYRPQWFITQTIDAYGSANPAGTLAVLNGMSTSVVYSADDWYRITDVLTNSQSVAGAANQRTNLVLFATVVTNIGVHATFHILPDGSVYSGVPTGWLLTWTEAAVAAGDGDAFGVPDEYRFGISPVSSNTLSLAVDSLSVADGTVQVVLKRTVSGLQSPDGMHATLKLLGADVLTGTYTNIATSTIGFPFGAGSVGTWTNTFPDAGSVRFYKAVIE